eukprot:m51a1_g1170 hypothetical protein (187) ;mRNA; r:373635-374326
MTHSETLTQLLDDDPCSKYPLSSHIPSRFRIASDPDWIGCGWKASYSAGRTCCGLLMIIYGIGSVVALVLVPRKWSFVLPSLMILGGGIGYFVVGVRDGSSITDSRSWCNGGLEGLNWTTEKPDIHCDYGPHIGTAFLDFLSALLWVVLGVVGIIVLWKTLATSSGESAGTTPNNVSNSAPGARAV